MTVIGGFISYLSSLSYLTRTCYEETPYENMSIQYHKILLKKSKIRKTKMFF